MTKYFLTISTNGVDVGAIEISKAQALKIIDQMETADTIASRSRGARDDCIEYEKTTRIIYGTGTRTTKWEITNGDALTANVTKYTEI